MRGQGRFENPLILEIFGIVHFDMLADIPEDSLSDARPVGSLIMAKLAVRSNVYFMQSI